MTAILLALGLLAAQVTSSSGDESTLRNGVLSSPLAVCEVLPTLLFLSETADLDTAAGSFATFVAGPSCDVWAAGRSVVFWPHENHPEWSLVLNMEALEDRFSSGRVTEKEVMSALAQGLTAGVSLVGITFGEWIEIEP